MAEIETGLLEGAIAPAENTKLFGHEAAEAFLAQSYRRGKSHHAILIEGPEGIGKATLAFRFANHVLVHPVPEEAPVDLADPDPQSFSYRQIVAGASHNLLHLSRPVDAKTGKRKSAITVDEVRRAGKFFSQTTGSDSWRIVIVDPADDLNRNAANAILKMLEEPPRRSLFLVLSHAPGKLLPTIRSRCQPLLLRALGPEPMQQAVSALGLALPAGREDDVLAKAGGSVAQALRLINYGGLDMIEAFEQMVSASGPAQRRAMHKLADAAAHKDNETLYRFFVDHAEQVIAGAARKAALAQDSARAFRLATLSSKVSEQVSTADAFNLDRKQTVLALLGEIAENGVS